MRRTYAMLLVAATGALSCNLGNEGPRRMVTGVLEFRAAKTLQAIPAPYLVAMDSIHIDVESGGGADRHSDGRKLLPMDTVVTATTRVLEGLVNVSARVLNTRRDTLFAGTTSGTVSGDGFQLTLTLVPLRPVLAVSPAPLTFGRSSGSTPRIDQLTIYNRGDSSLVWRTSFTGCTPNQCFIRANTSPIPANSSRVVDIVHVFLGSASGTLTVSAQRDSLIIPYQVP